MKIIYHHHRDPLKEKEDEKLNWWTCPPELICTKKESEKLINKWIKYKGKNAYIVDPLGYTQCLYIMLNELPFSKIRIKFIEKEHKYDI